MASPYIINITDGVGQENILNGNYAVTASVTGYDNTSVLPATQTIVAGTDTYAFTLAATGTLTLHVTDDGTETGTDIVGATFYRCDAAGLTYGAAVVSDTDGNAVFSYVPYAASDAPVIYYKQTTSDGAHEFDATLQNTTMTTSAETIEIENAPPALRTIGLTDANYANLPIGDGTLTLTAQ